MKKNKAMALLLTVVLLISAVLSGCTGAGNSNDEQKNNETGGAEASGSDTAIDHSKTLTLDVYDNSANYQGTQTGWFGKILKDKFNLELNIIAPNVSGDAETLFQTRATSGNLGDLIIVDNAKLQDCLAAGLVSDIAKDIPRWKNLNEFSNQITTFNETLEGTDGKVYAIPACMSNTSADDYTGATANGPYLPWDYYSELGFPEMNNSEDLLNVLEQMQKTYPTNKAGDAAYAITLWSDWDNDAMENVVQLTPWYGEQVNGSLLIDGKGGMKELTDEAGAYYKMLYFLYEANQRGLVDPDSATQDWDSASNKMKNKQVYLFWYAWQTGFWNTAERADNNDAYTYVPVADQHFFQLADGVFGNGTTWSIGSAVDDEKKARILEFLDWMTTAEANDLFWVGLKDFNYKVGEDGKYIFMKENEGALMNNMEVPAEYGGGGYADGMNQMNMQVIGGDAISPLTGEAYSFDRWSSYIADNQTKMSKEWSEKYGAANQVDYLKKNNMFNIVPNVNMVLESDNTDIGLIRGQCRQLIRDYSWQMVYAGNEEEFKNKWLELKKQLEGFGWNELVDFDKTKYQKLIDARSEALK